MILIHIQVIKLSFKRQTLSSNFSPALGLKDFSVNWSQKSIKYLDLLGLQFTTIVLARPPSAKVDPDFCTYFCHCQFLKWDKQISRYNKEKTRVRYTTLTLSKKQGGLLLPNVRD